MTKLLFITERFPPLPGGMAVSAERQVTSLRKRGMLVDVLVMHHSPGETGIGVKTCHRDGGKDLIFRHDDQHGNASQRAYRDVFEQHVREPYDLIVGFGACFPGYVAVTYGAFLGLPAMVSVRGNDFDRDWFEPKRAHFVREALGRADRIAAVSREKVAKISSLFPGKPVFWHPNGQDTERFRLLPREEEARRNLRMELGEGGKRIIGLFGELKYKKQVPAFLAALREPGLKDRVTLLVTGRLNEECDALLADPELSPSSRHLSFRDRDDLPPLYAACDFMAIPSLFEGFPNVLLEAMAAGAVPLVSPAGAMADVIEHGRTGFIMDPLDRIRCAEVLNQALSLPDTDLSAMKDRVKAYVETHFNPEREADILETHIMRTLNIPSPSLQTITEA